MNPSLFRAGAVLVVLLSLAIGCGNPAAVKEITETRKLEQAPPSPPPNLSSAERFGMRTAVTPPPATVLPFTWTVPEGWRKSPDRPMRAVTFTMGAEDAAECYVSVFPGDAGGLEANINRWAGQMGAGSLDAAAIAALPTVAILGDDAPTVEFAGTFTDAMTGNTIENAVLLGVVAEHGDNSIFIKLVGPASEVTAQKQNFIAFCQSLRH